MIVEQSPDLSSKLTEGDAFIELQKIESDSIDLIVTDPPYGYSFMNKHWDKAVVGVDIWKECLRVLKSGAFAFIMSAPRQDVLCKMILNLIEAGFETNFTSLYHTYASGFPKAKNLRDGSYAGFQPKPAVEVILVVMKPLSAKSFTDQALANGRGITWLDDCRIPFQDNDQPNNETRFARSGIPHADKDGGRPWIENRISNSEPVKEYTPNQKGRFPANLLVSDHILNDSYSRYFDLDKWFNTAFPFIITPKASKSEKNMGLIDSYFELQTTDDGRAKPIDNAFQRGQTLRYNNHPTVKPIKLMSYLITLGSRSNDIVLDPFCGSGTTCIAAKMLNRNYMGIDINKEYIDISNARLKSVDIRNAN